MSAGGGFKGPVAAGLVSDTTQAAAPKAMETPSNNPFAGISFKAHVDPLTPIQSLVSSSPQVVNLHPKHLSPDKESSVGLSIQIPSIEAASSSGAEVGTGGDPSPSPMAGKTGLPPKNSAAPSTGTSSSSSSTHISTSVASSSSPSLSLVAPSPGKSPKLNPFSSASPKTNPFMSMGKPKDHFWGESAGGTEASGAVDSKEKEGSVATARAADSSAVASALVNAAANTREAAQVQLGAVVAPTPTVAPVVAPAAAVAAAAPPVIAPAVPAPVNNPFLASSSGIALNIPGNVFGAFGSGLGGSGSIFPIHGVSGGGGASNKPFGSCKNGGGILSTLGGAPLTAMFGSTAGAQAAKSMPMPMPAVPVPVPAAASSSDCGRSEECSAPTTQQTEDKAEGADDADDADEDPEEDRTPAVFGKTYSLLGGEIVTGEEAEECVLQVRAKLYRLVTTHKKNRLSDDEDADTSAGGADEEVRDQGVPVASSPTAAITPNKNILEWVEVGVGPLKILRRKDTSATNSGSAATCLPEELDTRIVMRREEKKGGAGTKLLLNLRLTALCSIGMSGEKAFSVSTLVSKSVAQSDDEDQKPAAVEAVSYMLKCKLAGETDKAYSIVKKTVDSRKKKP